MQFKVSEHSIAEDDGGGGDPSVIDKIKDFIKAAAHKLFRFLIILAVCMEIFVSGPKVELTADRNAVLREMPEADISPEDYELIDELIVAVNNTEPRDLELHGWAAYRNGERFFKETADVTVRHIVYDRDAGRLDITYETGKNREILLYTDGDEYGKVLMVYDNLPGWWLGHIPGQIYAAAWGHYTCYTCRVSVRTGEVRGMTRAVYRHNWLAWFPKVRDWSRNTMLSQTESGKAALKGQ